MSQASSSDRYRKYMDLRGITNTVNLIGTPIVVLILVTMLAGLGCWVKYLRIERHLHEKNQMQALHQ